MEDNIFVSTPSSISPCLSMDNLFDPPELQVDSVVTNGNWTTPTAPPPVPSHRDRNDVSGSSKVSLDSSFLIHEILSSSKTAAKNEEFDNGTKIANRSSSSARISPHGDDREIRSMEKLQQEHDEDSYKLLNFFSDLKFDSSTPPSPAQPKPIGSSAAGLAPSSIMPVISTPSDGPGNLTTGGNGLLSMRADNVPSSPDVSMDPSIIFARQNEVVSSSVPGVPMDPNIIFDEKHLETTSSKFGQIFQESRQKEKFFQSNEQDIFIETDLDINNNKAEDDDDDLSLEDLIQIGKTSAAFMDAGSTFGGDDDDDHGMNGEISFVAGRKKGGMRGSLPPIHLHYGGNNGFDDDQLMNSLEDMLTGKGDTKTKPSCKMDSLGSGGSTHVRTTSGFPDPEQFIGKVVYSNPSTPTAGPMVTVNHTKYPDRSQQRRNFVRGLSTSALTAHRAKLQEQNQKMQVQRRSSASATYRKTRGEQEPGNYLQKNQNQSTVRRRASSGSIDPKQIVQRLKQSMCKSLVTQKALQSWDKQAGLPLSHSQTMVNTARSRIQLQEEVVVTKWGSGAMTDQGNTHDCVGVNKNISGKQTAPTLTSGSCHKQTTLGSSSLHKRTTLGSSSHKRRPRRTSKSAASAKKSPPRKKSGRRMSSPASTTVRV